MPIDVPSLLGIYLRPRFLHDGRAERLVDIFQRWNASDRHSHTSDLSSQDLEDIEAFLVSLPYEAAEMATTSNQTAGGG